jgi:hexosaminidase
MFGDRITPGGLHEAVARGITHLELSIPPDGETCVPSAEFQRIASEIDGAGMQVWSVHAPFGAEIDLSHPDELIRRRSVGQIRRACEVADMVGAKCIVVHAGNTASDEAEQDLRRRQSLRSLNCLLGRTCQLGLQLAVEYLPPNKERLCNDSAEIREMLSLCDGTPGVCLDTNHANLREDLAEVTRALGDMIVTVHLSDNDGEQELHAMPGEGVIDWSEFMDALDEIGYEGPLVYETLAEETVAETMEMTVTSAREVLGWEAPDG